MHRRGNKWFAMNVTQVGEDVSLHLKDGFFWASVPAESLDSGFDCIRSQNNWLKNDICDKIGNSGLPNI